MEKPKPVSLAQLKQQWPALEALTIEQQQRFSSTVNLLPAPCEQCDGKTIAKCGTTVDVQTCDGLKRIVRRTIDGIQAEWSPVEIRQHANYPDLWFDISRNLSGTNVHLFRDVNGLFAQETETVRAELANRYTEQVQWTIHEAEDDGHEFGVRSRPTWFINGFRFRGVQSADTLGRFISYEIEDQKRWER
ncbi:MAG: hypothetical protein ACPGTU_17215 [Myxococcota bacterium]